MIRLATSTYLSLTVRYISFDLFLNFASYSFDPSQPIIHRPLRLHWLKAKESFRASALGRVGEGEKGKEGWKKRKRHGDKQEDSCVAVG